jgi:hypothetical protein
MRLKWLARLVPPAEEKVGTPRFDFENVISLGASGA